jgi:hypothetical protein
MLSPPILHEPLRYPAGFRWEILKEQSITGKELVFQLRKMLAPFPCKHIENANESIAGNILIAFCEGSGHCCDLHPEPLKEIRQRGIDGELSAPSTERSHRGLCITLKLGQLPTNRILKPL